MPIDYSSGVILLLAYLTALFVGHVFVKIMLKKFPLDIESGFKYAGAMIGFLERALILTFILVGEYIAIGLILTAKSIARFDELKDRKFSEYFLIGTLSSILITVFTGLVTLWALGRI